MQYMTEGSKAYQKAVKSEGSEKTNLLGVLKKGLSQGSSNGYENALQGAWLEGGRREDFARFVCGRAGLVGRHMEGAQEALQEIYEVAKEKGYGDITEIFGRTYHVGYPKRG